ncbi:MAG: DinB family protein [Gemmatimonadetes bacterium]|nr:DinB family protein [Gemmatimonadota bacterium]
MDLKPALQSQYQAALQMLVAAIEKCPEPVWLDPAYTNATWHVAYHVLHYADLYLHQRLEDFSPWSAHRDGCQKLAKAPGAPPLEPYARSEILAYARALAGRVPAMIRALDLGAPEAGYPWYRMPKLEHQLVGLRHLHHHTGQIAERVRERAGQGLAWVQGVPAA